MSTPTETEFLDGTVQEDTTTTTVTSETELDTGQHQRQPGHHKEHEHVYDEDGNLSPMCSGGGCVTKLPTG
ncbi:hypothetical protein AB0G02_23260 [Actinosynnema sp. NPDC023658]|uniref:hypothetical protein n=1 Tax=Actinosynnema sp. NPDC023658 TaxID=3155465 RepID=UPI0033FAAB04